MRLENREWKRVRGDDSCVSADQYALAGSIIAVPVRSSDEQPKPKPITDPDSRGGSAVTPVMTHGGANTSVSSLKSRRYFDEEARQSFSAAATVSPNECNNVEIIFMTCRLETVINSNWAICTVDSHLLDV